MDLLECGEAIVMAGAGCSSNYPDWPELIEKMKLFARNEDKDFDEPSEDFLTFAEKVKILLGEPKYNNMIHRLFKDVVPPFTEVHKSICRLAHQKHLKGIVTTNYDPSFLNAWSAATGESARHVCIDNTEEAQVFEFLASLDRPTNPRLIFHPHGFHNLPASIILCKSEYEKKYGFSIEKSAKEIVQSATEGTLKVVEMEEYISHSRNWTLHRKILWALFATRRLIFLGFSMTDPFFNAMLDYVSKDLHTYGYDNHYLILRISSADKKLSEMARAKRLKEQFGIETIFFEERKKGEKGLENFLLDTEYQVQKSIAPTGPEPSQPEKPKPEMHNGDKELTKQLIEKSRNR